MSMLKTTRNTLALAAVAVTALAAGSTVGSTEAEAKKIFIKVGHFHHHHLSRHRVIVPLIATSYVGSCYGLKLKALNTGSPHWWARYADCRGF